MNTLIKPIMFFIFIMGLIFFLNIVLLFVRINQTDIILNKVSYIVQKDVNDVSELTKDINKLKLQYNNEFNVEYQYYYDNEFLDSTQVEVSTIYHYLGRKKDVTIKKNTIVMNQQM